MPIQFRCPKCDRRLSIAQRKAGTQTACPNCRAPVTVPVDDGPPLELPGPTSELASAAPSQDAGTDRRFRVGAIVGGSVLLLTLLLIVLLVIRKPTEKPDHAHNDALPAPPSTLPATTQPSPTPALLPQIPVKPADPIPQPAPLPQTTPQPQPVPSQPAPVSPGVTEAPPPRPARPLAVVVEPIRTYDRFGNPIGPDVGLGKDGEFKGQRLLFWSGYENAGNVFFGPTNPLWKAWERQGFVVSVRFGPFKPEWLRDVEQLWILSTGRFELPPGVPPELVAAAVDLLPPSAIPSGFTPAEYKFIVQATLDMSLSRVHPLDDRAYREIVKFVQAGKGLCLLSDDEPFTVESNELAKRLYGVGVKGNYLADKIGYVRQRKLAPADVVKFKGQYEVDDHPLLTGINFLFEGITISNVEKSDKLEVALKASDGQPLIAVSKVPGQRVVIDCAFTQFCHGPTERTSYVLKSPGAIRLAQNVAAYLAGKDGVKAP